MRVYWVGVFMGIEGSVTKRKRLSSTSFKESQGTYLDPNCRYGNILKRSLQN